MERHQNLRNCWASDPLPEELIFDFTEGFVHVFKQTGCEKYPIDKGDLKKHFAKVMSGDKKTIKVQGEVSMEKEYATAGGLPMKHGDKQTFAKLKSMYNGTMDVFYEEGSMENFS